MKITRLFFLLFPMLFLLLGCGQQPEDLSFDRSPETVLQQAATMDYFHSLYEVMDSSLNTSSNFLLVDLRSPAKYERDHLPNAVNIPVANLLDEEAQDLLKASPKVVLYGSERSDSNGPWFLLTQMGIDQVKILEFGYRDVTERGSAYAPEIAHYDFATIFQVATERHAKEVEAGKPKPVVVKQKKTIIPKKKAKEEEGC